MMNKKDLWKEAEQKTAKITDKLGKKIDGPIRGCITALLALGFPTSQSCGGHYSKKRTVAPWVEIYQKPPEGWKDDLEKKRSWSEENYKFANQMFHLFLEFYEERKTSFDTLLCFVQIGCFGGFRFQSTGSPFLNRLADGEKRKKLEEYRKEMSDFSKFLKKKFFQN
ncbi:MAG: hypothetical protein PHX25_03855 [Candidatus Pacebacteria bacterium]|nr:hypothetical protein [Candidatus Paceibacterota bacterium]